MTGKEIIKLIKEKDLEDYNFAVQFRDEGGNYDGEETIKEVYIDEETKTVIV